jgi:hypothetical protein
MWMQDLQMLVGIEVRACIGYKEALWVSPGTAGMGSPPQLLLAWASRKECSIDEEALLCVVVYTLF